VVRHKYVSIQINFTNPKAAYFQRTAGSAAAELSDIEESHKVLTNRKRHEALGGGER